MSEQELSMTVPEPRDPGGDLVDHLARLIGGRARATVTVGTPIERDDITVIRSALRVSR